MGITLRSTDTSIYSATHTQGDTTHTYKETDIPVH